MLQAHQSLIQTAYGFSQLEVAEGPRQFVALTYILTADAGQKFFCKITTKPVFITQVKNSLPSLRALHDAGCESICYPISTQTGELYVMADDALIVLYNLIDWPQSYEYDTHSFGKLTAQIHSFSPKVIARVDQPPLFQTKYEHLATLQRWLFNTEVSIKLSPTSTKVDDQLHSIVARNRNLLIKLFDRFQHHLQTVQLSSQDLVITNGDAPGNTLVKSRTELFIIDWDELLFAPAERDTWFFINHPDFFNGYASVRPGFTPNPDLHRLCVLTYFFNSVAHYIHEIETDTDPAQVQTHLKGLAGFLDPATSLITPFIQTLKLVDAS